MSPDERGQVVEHPAPDTDAPEHPDDAPRIRRLPVMGRVVLAVALVVANGLFVTAWLFVWPPSTTPAVADAVVVLSGDHGERLPRALELLRRGVSTTLVQVGEPDSSQAQDLCDTRTSFQVYCLRPTGDSTQTEARSVGQLARSRGWQAVVVVTSTQHAARAGLVFRRCLPGTVDVVPARPAFGWRLMGKLIAIEWAKLGYSLTVDRGC